MPTWKQGDVIVERDGDRRKILGVCGEVIFISLYKNFDRADHCFTQKQLEDLGYKLEEKEW